MGQSAKSGVFPQNAVRNLLQKRRKRAKINGTSKGGRNMDSKKLKSFLVIFFLSYCIPIVTSGIVRAIAIYTFVTPNTFAPGGINGLAVLLEYITGQAGFKINSGYFLIIFNVPLFFVAWFMLGKREAIIATGSMLFTSGLLILFDYIPGFPIYGEETERATATGILAAVASGILLGAALAIMLRSCGTAGGTSIIASVVKKKWKYMSVSWLTFGFDAIVVVAFFFVYNSGGSFMAKLEPVLLALVSLFVTSKTSDIIIHGFQTAYKFEIVTDHPEELAKEIMEKTHHGVTLMHATGMYTHGDKSMLICIIRKRQIADVQRIIKSHPDTFAFFSQTSEVYGKFAK